MTAPILKELQWLGIDMPTHPRPRFKTRCPTCSPTRRKKGDRCANIELCSDTRAEFYCHHCKDQKEIRV